MDTDLPAKGLMQLGVGSAQLQTLFDWAGKPFGEAYLRTLKKNAKANFRKAALILHPDVNGGDESKTAQFRELSKAIAFLDQIDLVGVAKRKETQDQHKNVEYWKEVRRRVVEQAELKHDLRMLLIKSRINLVVEAARGLFYLVGIVILIDLIIRYGGMIGVWLKANGYEVN
jgi:hypothetical protein